MKDKKTFLCYICEIAQVWCFRVCLGISKNSTNQQQHLDSTNNTNSTNNIKNSDSTSIPNYLQLTSTSYTVN